MDAAVVLELALSARHQLSHEWAFACPVHRFLAVTTLKLLGKQQEEEEEEEEEKEEEEEPA
ncbi:uncharacterized protein TrAFT101_007680 [Trichoderma asperellum]|uniref:uncharacterized protein n=1 Tax=Trichoderma asperellum TaxID=101201 RepID=UPI003326B5A4|nr:hypothetical protein TrAFT101_007680 [Trichoderma asperellum]